jgi:hypothetical protein
MDEKKHPGITMHKISFGGGFEGLLFALGSVLIFLFGIPALWYFVAFSVAFGIIVAIAFRLISRHRAETAKPLSILQIGGVTDPSSIPPPKDERRHSPSLQLAPDAT